MLCVSVGKCFYICTFDISGSIELLRRHVLCFLNKNKIKQKQNAKAITLQLLMDRHSNNKNNCKLTALCTLRREERINSTTVHVQFKQKQQQQQEQKQQQQSAAASSKISKLSSLSAQAKAAALQLLHFKNNAQSLQQPQPQPLPQAFVIYNCFCFCVHHCFLFFPILHLVYTPFFFCTLSLHPTTSATV